MRFGQLLSGPQLVATFTGADSSTTPGNADTGQVGTSWLGTHGITSNKLYTVTGTNGATYTYALATPTSRVDATIVTDTIQTHVHGLTLRYIDVNNRLLVTTFGGAISIGTQVAGVFNARTTVNTSPATGAANFVLSATVIGAGVTVLVNGVQITQYTLTSGEQTAFLASANAGTWFSWSAGSATVATIDNLVMY